MKQLKWLEIVMKNKENSRKALSIMAEAWKSWIVLRTRMKNWHFCNPLRMFICKCKIMTKFSTVTKKWAKFHQRMLFVENTSKFWKRSAEFMKGKKCTKLLFIILKNVIVLSCKEQKNLKVCFGTILFSERKNN